MEYDSAPLLVCGSFTLVYIMFYGNVEIECFMRDVCMSPAGGGGNDMGVLLFLVRVQDKWYSSRVLRVTYLFTVPSCSG